MTNANLVAVNNSNQELDTTNEPQEAAAHFSNFAEFYPFEFVCTGGLAVVA